MPALKLDRRTWLRCAGGSLAAAPCLGSFSARGAQAATDTARKCSCILLWMAGGPSQVDKFDPKPGHENGGPFREIQTSVPGIRIAEHLPGVAQQAERLAIIR